MPLQTDYTDQIAAGVPGMVANGETSNRITRTCEDADGAAFGAGAFLGAGDHGFTTTVTAGEFLGVTTATSALGLIADQNADEYAQFDNVAIMTMGAIYVNVTGAVTPGAAITIATADGTFSATAADASNIATGFVADETVTDGVCLIAKR